MRSPSWEGVGGLTYQETLTPYSIVNLVFSQVFPKGTLLLIIVDCFAYSPKKILWLFLRKRPPVELS